MSEQTNQQTSEEEVKHSPEEMARMRSTMLDYYKKQNTVLRAQSEYEKHLADIEESRLKRMTMSIRLAQLMAGPQEEVKEKPEKKEDNE
jgi:hypothetical protein